jgi:hypothetical protein
MATPGRVFRDLKKFRDRVTHEVPTGPHTDVKKRKINPSFKKKLTGIGAGTKGGFGVAKRRRAIYKSGGAVLKGKKVGCQIK